MKQIRCYFQYILLLLILASTFAVASAQQISERLAVLGSSLPRQSSTPNSSNVELVASINIAADSVAVAGSLLYVGADDRLVIFDISKPDRLRARYLEGTHHD